MRVLLFSDLHAHQFKPYSITLPNGINSRLQDTLDILNQIKVIAESNKVGLILFGGDLFHVRRVINVQTFNLVFEAIARLKLIRGIQIGLLVGNHDQSDRSGGVHSIYAFGSMVEVMDRVGWQAFVVGQEQLNILAVLYFTNKQTTLELIKNAGITTGNGPVAMLGHFGVSGALVGSNFVMIDKELMELEDLHSDNFNQVFLGHYHETQQLAPNVRYIGAPIQHNWGDSGQDRGCLLWDTNTNKVNFIPLRYPHFVRMNLDELEHLPNLKVKGDFIRVVCPAGCRPKQEEELKEQMLNLGARTVEFVEETVEVQTISHGPYQPGMDMETMIRNFVLSSNVPMDDNMLIDTGLSLYQSAVAEDK